MMRNDISTLSHQELTIHQIIDVVIANCIQYNIEINSQYEFDKSINNLTNEIFKNFKNKYEKIKDHEKYKTIFLNAVRFKQDELLHIPDFSGTIFDVKEIDGNAEKTQTYFDSIRVYCKEKNKDDKEVMAFLVKIHALISVYHEIGGHYLNLTMINDNKINKTHETLLIVEAFQNTLVAIATGSKGEETDYKKFRDELLKTNELNSLIPDFVKLIELQLNFGNLSSLNFLLMLKGKSISGLNCQEYSIF